MAVASAATAPPIQPPATAERFYHPEIDILRFGAFLLVYLWHALPPQPRTYLRLGFPAPIAKMIVGLIHGGAYGVDLFFALSSYLITELLLREYRLRGAIDVKAFYMRRMLRIWPLYFTALFLGSALMKWFDPNQQTSLGYLLCFTFLLGNWACALWGFPSSCIAPLWSVSVEEQFYLLWPLAMSRWMRHIRKIAIGLIVCSFLARAVAVLWGAQYPFTWCSTLTRLDPIGGGILLAVLLNGRAPRFGAATRIAMVAAGLALLIAVGSFGELSGPSVLITYPVAAIAALLMIAGTLTDMKAAPGHWLAGVFVHLGRISYGLYVFHIAAIQLTSKPSSSSARWALNIVESLGLTILLALISYRWLETPFLRLKKKFSWIESSPAALPAPAR